MAEDINADRLPNLSPLARSYTSDDAETELQQLFSEVFAENLAADTFDMNVLGALHLGSLGVIRRSMSYDGLTVLPSYIDEKWLRHMYRAWRSGKQNRGLHFLRTYLNAHFPYVGKVVQLWQKKDAPYPEDLSETASEDRFLTSRVRVSMAISPDEFSPAVLLSVVSQVAPARLIVDVRYAFALTSSLVRLRNRSSVSRLLRTEGSCIPAPVV